MILRLPLLCAEFTMLLACSSGRAREETRDAQTPAADAQTLTGDAQTTGGSYPDATCVDTENDPHNCGACGHDCLGAPCEAGVCAAAAGAVVLAKGRDSPGPIALDSASVYWIDRGTSSIDAATPARAQLLKCAKTGCGNTPTVIADGPWSDVTKLVLDGPTQSLYWAASNQILQCPTSGCGTTPTVVWSGSATPPDFIVDEGGLYLAEGSQVLHCPTEACDGGAAISWFPGMQLSQVGNTSGLAIDSGNFYLLAGSTRVAQIERCSVGACDATAKSLSLISGVQSVLSALAVGSANVYFVDTGGLQSGAGQVLFVAKNGPGQPAGAFLPQNSQPLLAGLSLPSAIAIDDKSLYVAESGDLLDGSAHSTGTGRIDKCALVGCDGVPTIVQDFVNNPQAIAVDGTTVYFTDFGLGNGALGTSDGRVVACPK